ncbi:MAG: ABC transporter substrate-binding protein [Eubacteriaceae bacterium]|nr:ABC transporter substrate-binding protein [Eubacteriaceae bacterium]
MKTRRALLLFLALVFAATLIAGCAKRENTDTTPNDNNATGGPVAITDIAGRTVELEKPAEKIVGTHNPTLNIAIILGGGGEYLVGFGNKNMAGSLYEHVYPELADDVVQIGRGREINIESVIEVEADLAILPERFLDVAELFVEAGVPAAVILPNNESFDTIKNSIELLGTLVGAEERAALITGYFDGKINASVELVKDIGENPTALFLGGSSQLTVANGAMLQSLMLETVGAVNAAKDIGGAGEFVEVNIEEIIAWNPQVIYIPAYANYSVDDLLADPAWGSIQAVIDSNIHVFPCDLEPWDYPTPSTALGLSWLVHNLYPELYTIGQVVDDANEYYNLVYGQTFTPQQLGLE